MKQSIVYLFFIVFGGVLIGWGLLSSYQVVKASTMPNACSFFISSLSSDEASESIKTLFEQSIMRDKVSFLQAIASVQKTFPHCSFLACRQQPSGVVQVRIECDEPLCALNNDMALTCKGALVPRTVYAEDALIGLPHVSIKNASDGLLISSAQFDFLQRLPYSVFLSHEVVYHSDDKVFLIPHIQTDKAYLCDVNTVIDRELLRRSTTVFADLEQQKILHKKKARTAWVLDVRFDKQIILYPDMGGQVHG